MEKHLKLSLDYHSRHVPDWLVSDLVGVSCHERWLTRSCVSQEAPQVFRAVMPRVCDNWWLFCAWFLQLDSGREWSGSYGRSNSRHRWSSRTVVLGACGVCIVRCMADKQVILFQHYHCTVELRNIVLYSSLSDLSSGRLSVLLWVKLA